MPRVIASNSDCIDYCKECFIDSQTAEEVWGDIGEAEDNRGNVFEFDAVHPDYEDGDYECHECCKPLTKKDD
jgi:hypothetical protein